MKPLALLATAALAFALSAEVLAKAKSAQAAASVASGSHDARQVSQFLDESRVASTVSSCLAAFGILLWAASVLRKERCSYLAPAVLFPALLLVKCVLV